MSELSKCSRCGKIIPHTHLKNDDKIRVSFQLNRTISIYDSSYLSTVSETCSLCTRCNQSLLEWFYEENEDI